MEKMFMKGAFLSVMLLMTLNAEAQFDLNSLSNKVSNAVSKVTTSKNETTNTTAATTSNIAGTWTYKRPAVSFKSGNLLKKAGGSVASSAIESQLQEKFATMGLTADKMKLTFDNNGKFSGVMGGKSVSGTYTLSGTTLTFNFLNGMKGITATAEKHSGDLEVVFDSTKLLKFMSAVGKLSTNSTVSTISSLAGSYDGMQAGMRFSKSK